MQLGTCKYSNSGRLLTAVAALGLIPVFASVPDPGKMNRNPGATTQRRDGNSARSSVASANQNPAVFPPGPYAEWSAKWWQWVYGTPASVNPIIDNTGAHCAQGQEGPVWFLAGTFVAGAVTRTCTIPNGVSLFFPVANIIFGAGVGDCETPGVAPASCEDYKIPNPLFGFITLSQRDTQLTSVAALREAAALAQDNPVGLEADLDGVAFTNLENYRAKSPAFSVTLPADNLMNVLFGASDPAGTYHPDVSDGYWLMLKPLSTGHHTLHFQVGDPNAPFVNVTYILNVQ